MMFICTTILLLILIILTAFKQYYLYSLRLLTCLLFIVISSYILVTIPIGKTIDYIHDIVIYLDSYDMVLSKLGKIVMMQWRRACNFITVREANENETAVEEVAGYKNISSTTSSSSESASTSKCGISPTSSSISLFNCIQLPTHTIVSKVGAAFQMTVWIFVYIAFLYLNATTAAVTTTTSDINSGTIIDGSGVTTGTIVAGKVA